MLCHMDAVVAQIGRQGRLVVPAEMRRELGLEAGAQVVLRADDGALVVEPLGRAVSEVQAEVAPHLERGRSLVDELIEERRTEAQDE